MRLFLPYCNLIVVSFAIAGCQAKLTVSKTFTLPGEDSLNQSWEMPPQPSEQNIKITVNVKKGPSVDVFVVNAADIGDVIDGGGPKEKKRWEEKGYGFKRNVKSETITVKIPANVKYKVNIMQSDDAKDKSEVEVKITN